MSLPPDIEAIDPERRLTNEEELPPPWLSPEVCVREGERESECICGRLEYKWNLILIWSITTFLHRYTPIWSRNFLADV